MVSDLIGTVADEVGGAVDDAVGEDLAKADAILQGKERSPADLEAVEAEFVRGVDLATPDGDVPSTAAAPNDPQAGSASSASTLSVGKRIEFIHFGQVHRDWARSFHHDQAIHDGAAIDLSTLVGARAICFRAALEREAMLLAGFARGTQAALAEKKEEEGAMADLLTAAADLVGGAMGTTQTAVAADLEPFLEKIDQDAWTPINTIDISYAGLHTAGIKLHEVRVNLRKYLRDQVEAQNKGSSDDKGLLSDLPFIGEITIPGFLGEAVGFMQKVTGKLHDVQTALIFELVLAMQIPIEKACLQASLDQIRKRTSPIYPTWFVAPEEGDSGEDKPFADYQQGDVIQGDLKKIGALDDINQGIKDGVADANQAINEAVAPGMEIYDFLSKPVEPAPGSPYLAEIFGAQKVKDGPFVGSAGLSKVAVATFGRAMGAGEVPGFMQGFVSDFLAEVFGVCTEFMRAVYEKLCCLKPLEVVQSAELVKAGREHLLFKLIDYALEKSGLTEMLEDFEIKIPEPPMVPAGFNWPSEPMRPDPLIALLKAKLSDELGPYLDPVVEYAMSGLAERLNAQRAWAGPRALTMEVHLAQMPAELAVMFRNLFGPLWEFLTDTLMGAINDVMGEVLGPMAEGVGLAKEGLGFVTGAIADAKKKAAQAQAYAKNVEDKVGALMDELSDVSIGTGDTSDIGKIMGAADDLADAVGADPFADGPGGGGGGGGPGGTAFPGNRKPLGKGTKIERAEMDEVEPDLKWEEAKVAGADAEPAEAGEGEEGSP
ncbi:MAG: hypothetical protein JRI23_15010 [Deltaproteobacteria bacterium]|nr:hypothetical protein [Deltaproteobacteria bacterium]MBW2533060.1 hypothetical protein [Deltaproteobacteria bacterium]